MNSRQFVTLVMLVVMMHACISVAAPPSKQELEAHATILAKKHESSKYHVYSSPRGSIVVVEIPGSRGANFPNVVIYLLDGKSQTPSNHRGLAHRLYFEDHESRKHRIHGAVTMCLNMSGSADRAIGELLPSIKLALFTEITGHVHSIISGLGAKTAVTKLAWLVDEGAKSVGLAAANEKAEIKYGKIIEEVQAGHYAVSARARDVDEMLLRIKGPTSWVGFGTKGALRFRDLLLIAEKYDDAWETFKLTAAARAMDGAQMGDLKPLTDYHKYHNLSRLHHVGGFALESIVKVGPKLAKMLFSDAKCKEMRFLLIQAYYHAHAARGILKAIKKELPAFRHNPTPEAAHHLTMSVAHASVNLELCLLLQAAIVRTNKEGDLGGKLLAWIHENVLAEKGAIDRNIKALRDVAASARSLRETTLLATYVPYMERLAESVREVKPLCLPTSLRVETEPRGAKVSINGRPIPFMVSPVTRVLEDEMVMHGSVQVAAQLGGYKPLEKTVAIESGEKNKVLLKFEPVPEKETSLSIFTNPREAAILLNDKPVAGKPTPDIFPLTENIVKVGRVKVTAVLAGYESAVKHVAFKKDETTSVNIDLTKNDAPTRLSVSTRPKGGATVFLNGKEAIGMKTPLTVSLGPEMVEAGRVRVTAALTGYQRALQEVTIRPGQENKVTLQLGDLPDGPTAVEVITRPRGASVRLNGKMQPRQKTPGSYAVGPEIARTGVVDVTAELDGYEPCTRKVNLVRYKVVRVAMDLTPVKGGGIHAITTPVGAKVYGFSMGRKVAVGATPLMYSPPPEAWRRGTADLIFEPTSPHYSRRRVNRIGLEKDKIKRLEVELEKRPDKTSVAVVTKPKGATVFINGVELEGTRTPLTKRTPIDPDAKHIAETGSVEVTVALEGYERQTRQVALRRSEKSTVEFTLQQFGRQAWLEVITKPSGAQIFLDGANVPGKLTPAIVEVPPPVTAGDSAQVTVALPGYKTAARSVPIEPGGRKRVEFQLEPEAAGVTRLEVKTNPSGARVTINSRPAGGMVTPAVLRLDPQYVDRAITVGASLEGYLPAMRTVSPVKGQTTTVSMDLEREPKADPNAEVGMVDVVFCIDKSGSMKDDIQVMCEHAQDVFDQLSKYASDSGFSLQIGLVTYSRHTDRNWVDVWKLTPDVQEVLGHIRSIRITDVSLGSGGHEDIYGAMMLAMDMPVGGRQIEMGWRSGAVKIMVPIGDEPPAEPDWEGRTLDMVARRAEELDPVHMYPLIVPRRGTFHGGAAVRGMKRLASATGGEPIQVASANDLPHALISTVKFAVRRHREEVWRKQNPPYLLYSMLGGICGLILFALVFFVITQFRKRHGEGVLLVGYRRGILDGDLTGETSARRRSPPTDNSSTELHDPGRQG